MILRWYVTARCNRRSDPFEFSPKGRFPLVHDRLVKAAGHDELRMPVTDTIHIYSCPPFHRAHAVESHLQKPRDDRFHKTVAVDHGKDAASTDLWKYEAIVRRDELKETRV